MSRRAADGLILYQPRTPEYIHTYVCALGVLSEPHMPITFKVEKLPVTLYSVFLPLSSSHGHSQGCRFVNTNTDSSLRAFSSIPTISGNVCVFVRSTPSRSLPVPHGIQFQGVCLNQIAIAASSLSRVTCAFRDCGSFARCTST